MAFYITIFIILVLFSFIEVFTKRGLFIKILYWSVCLFLFTLSFLRWETGTDWHNYYEYFQRVLYRPYEMDEFEVGFRVLNYTIRSFTEEYTIQLFFSGLILFLFQSTAIKKLSPFPLLSLTCLFASQVANILFVRQWIAVAILFYSIIYIKKRKFIPFLLLVILATTIHRSSIIFIFSWWIFKAKISIKWMIIWLSLSVLFSFVVQQLLNSLLGTFGGVFIQAKLNMYLSESYNSEMNEQHNFLFILLKGVANKLFVFIISIIILRKEKKEDALKGIINIYWAGALLYFIAIPISVSLVRISFAFDIVYIVLVAYIVKSFKKKANRVFIFAVFLLYLSLRLFQFLNSTYSETFIPYKIVDIF